MYIYPNTDLYILKNVSLNNDYDHTIYFGSELAQRNFFSNNLRVKWILNNQSYQRKERGWIQVNLNQNDLWDCTYLMYRNTSYKNKWFYAFILSVDYVNDGVSRINFEIDVMQTWMFDYQLDKCFVEREHSATDNLFENTIEENLDIGPFYNIQVDRFYNFTPDAVVAIVTTNNTGTVVADIEIQGNIISGLEYITCRKADYSDFITYLKGYISEGIEDNVVAIFQVPSDLVTTTALSTNPPDYYESNYTFTSPNFTNIDGYVPKNKKLFTYPYNFMEISDSLGKVINLRWEMWDSQNDAGTFVIRGCIFGKPVMAIYPKNYRETTIDYDYGMTFDNFPTISWSGDSYQIWLAQNQKKYLANAFENAVEFVTTGRGGINLLGMIADELAAKKLPNRVHGESGGEIMSTQANALGFRLRQMTIKNEYAKIIDEYFSRFGYACHRIKVPNRNARQNWTYTKTIGCEIVGNLPSDDVVKIKEIYDHGITFWNDGLNVGYYGDFTNPVYS